MGCKNIGENKRRYNNNIDYEQSIKLLKQRYEYNSNKLKLSFEQKIKEINEKYNNSIQDEKNEYTKIKQKYEIQYRGKIKNLEFIFQHNREFQQNNNNEFKQEVNNQYYSVKTIKSGNGKLDLESIKNRMSNHLNYLIRKESNKINEEYINKTQEKKENNNYKNNNNNDEGISKENKNYEAQLEKINSEYQNEIVNMEENHKNKISNLKNNYESQLQQAIIENNENCQKLKDYYDGMIKARKIYETMKKQIINNDMKDNRKNEIKKEKNEYGLDIIEYSNKNELKFDQKECLICTEEFENGEKLALLKCNHCYHDQCIKEWIKKAKGIFCPLCQASRN